MHSQTLDNWQHSHDYFIDNKKGERRTQYVLILTAMTMLVEIIACISRCFNFNTSDYSINIRKIFWLELA